MRRWRAAVPALLLAACPLLSGCKVVSLAEDGAIRARRDGQIDAPSYVAGLWDAQAVPTLRRRTVDIGRLLPEIDSGLDNAGARFGRRTGEGAPWTFVVAGSGRITAIDAGTRRRTATVALDGAGGGNREVRVQIGPVVSGSAVRDALPFIVFDGFRDQLAFADIGRALTARAMAAIAPALPALRPGSRVRFQGVASVSTAADPIVITPVSLVPSGAGAA